MQVTSGASFVSSLGFDADNDGSPTTISSTDFGAGSGDATGLGGNTAKSEDKLSFTLSANIGITRSIVFTVSEVDDANNSVMFTLTQTGPINDIRLDYASVTDETQSGATGAVTIPKEAGTVTFKIDSTIDWGIEESTDKAYVTLSDATASANDGVYESASIAFTENTDAGARNVEIVLFKYDGGAKAAGETAARFTLTITQSGTAPVAVTSLTMESSGPASADGTTTSITITISDVLPVDANEAWTLTIDDVSNIASVADGTLTVTYDADAQTISGTGAGNFIITPNMYEGEVQRDVATLTEPGGNTLVLKQDGTDAPTTEDVLTLTADRSGNTEIPKAVNIDNASTTSYLAFVKSNMQYTITVTNTSLVDLSVTFEDEPLALGGATDTLGEAGSETIGALRLRFEMNETYTAKAAEIILTPIGGTAITENVVYTLNFSKNPLATPNLRQSTLKLYPNPTKDVLYVDSQKVSTYTVLNLEGVQMLKGRLKKGLNRLEVDVLPRGTYLFKIKANTFKFVVD